MRRILVCFKCKEGIYIHDGNPIRRHTEQIFKTKHSGHPIQIVNELPKGFKVLTEKDFYTGLE